jgi:hypothetical protein
MVRCCEWQPCCDIDLFNYMNPQLLFIESEYIVLEMTFTVLQVPEENG